MFNPLGGVLFAIEFVQTLRDEFVLCERVETVAVVRKKDGRMGRSIS